MPRNGLGTFKRAYRDAVAGTAKFEQFNGELQDVADELNNSLAKDGTTPMRGKMDMEGQELILDADGDSSLTADTDDQVDFKLGGTDRLSLTTAKANAIDSFSGASDTANTLLYATASNTYSSTAITSIGRSLIACTNPSEVFQLLDTGGFGEVLISDETASSDSVIDVAIDGTYSVYVWRLRGVCPTANSADPYLYTSANGGSSFDNGSGHYSYASTASATQIFMDFGTSGWGVEGGGTDGAGFSADIYIINPSASTYTDIWWTGFAESGVNAAGFAVNGGRRNSAAAVNAIRFAFSTNTILRGKFSLYGLS